MSQEPPFGSLFGAPTGSPSPVPPPDQGGPPPAPGPRPSGPPAPRAWYLRREVAVAGAALGVAGVLGAVAFVVLGTGGGDDLTTSAPARTPSASASASPGSPSPTVTRASGGRNPFVDQGGAAGGNTTGTATASTTAATTTTAAPTTTVTTTVAGPAVTTTKRVTTTKKVTTTKTRTVTAEPVFVYLRSLTGTTGEFTVNETEYDAVDEGDPVGDTGIVYEDTPGACIDVSYDGETYELCVDEALRLE